MSETNVKKATGVVPALVKPETIDQLLSAINAADLASPEVFRQLKKAIIERALGAELSVHLGYPKGDAKPVGQTNQRNGTSAKRILTDEGVIDLDVPRDRNGSFEPQLVEKGQRRFTGFDDKIISMYARGMTVREIQGHLEEIYGIEVSPDLISSVTDAVLEEAREWQNRPLESLYPVVVFDALRVKIRDDGLVRNKAVYLALGVQLDGTKDILGLWIEQNEGAKFWLKVMTELKNRGVQDILLAVVDGLKGFPEAISTIFPQTHVQTCIVHLTRYSLSFAGWSERKHLAKALRAIYRAPSAEAAAGELDAFAESDWGRKYPPVVNAWRRNWEQVIPFFAFAPEIRKIVYTTNAIESLHMQVRKVIKNRGHFPNDDAACKLIYLALRNITRDWKMPPREWKAAMTQFAIQFEGRFSASVR
jgi:putative transposase